MEDQELIDRYLANRLTDAEELMLATRIVKDRQFRSEVELTAAFREGLRELERRGEVSALLASTPSHWRRPQFAMAAVAAAMAVGLISLLLYQQRDELAPAVVTETLRFETTRSGDAQFDVLWRRTELPIGLDMEFDVGPEPAAKYRVTLQRIDDGVASAALDSVVPTAPTGEVVLTIDSAWLGQGGYEIRLEPQPMAEPDSVITYTLKVD